MFSERTSVGLDVHARSVVAHGIDQVTGEVFTSRLVPEAGSVIAWLADLPGPVATFYEAGPTGFGLARQLRSAGYRCEVAAPSKLQRPSGDRVKTDARDAEHLSRLLRLDEFTAVTVPDEATEAARDLVRCREDCRADLMRARHRVTKMLLRHGVVWSGGHAWTGDHLAWLSRQRFAQPVSQYAFDEALAHGGCTSEAPAHAPENHPGLTTYRLASPLVARRSVARRRRERSQLACTLTPVSLSLSSRA